MRLPDSAHSLQCKLAASFVAVIAMTALAMGFAVDRRSQAEILRVHADHGRTVARAFARACAPDVAAGDEAALSARLAALAADQVDAAAIVDADGRRLATFAAPGAADLDPLPTDPLTEFRELVRTGENVPPIGIVHLHIARDALMLRLDEARRQTIWLVVLALLLGTLAAMVAVRSALRPVRTLIRATRALARGSFKEVAALPRSRDEIGALSRAFRTMAWRLAASKRMLVESNAQLEQRVHARTAELERALRDLKSLDRMKDDFLSNVSHEFKTPLTNIRIAAEVVRDVEGLGDDTRASFLEQTIRETERLTHLVEELIDFVQLESDQAHWSLGRVDPLALAAEAVSGVADLARAKRLRLTLERACEIPPVRTDAERVRQVLVHLLRNSIQFTPTGRAITVGARHDGHSVTLFVRDEGLGIPDDEKARIFERFKQAGDTLTQKPPGAGLGLPLAKSIVDRLGGEMSVASRVGSGSTFAFTLPIDGPTPADLAGRTRRPVRVLDPICARVPSRAPNPTAQR